MVTYLYIPVLHQCSQNTSNHQYDINLWNQWKCQRLSCVRLYEVATFKPYIITFIFWPLFQVKVRVWSCKDMCVFICLHLHILAYQLRSQSAFLYTLNGGSDLLCETRKCTHWHMQWDHGINRQLLSAFHLYLKQRDEIFEPLSLCYQDDFLLADSWLVGWIEAIYIPGLSFECFRWTLFDRGCSSSDRLKTLPFKHHPFIYHIIMYYVFT